jgi:hypothetical protein
LEAVHEPARTDGKNGGHGFDGRVRRIEEDVLSMRLLAIDGAPRVSGYTRELFDLFVAGAAGAGAEVEQVHLEAMDVRPCRGCYACWHPSTPGRCVQRDDMDGLLERFRAADALLLATPVYYYSFSALLKAFVERLLPTTEPGIARGRTTGIGRNRLRQPESGPRRAVLMAVGAHRDPANMAGVVASFRLVCEGIDAENAGELLRPESYLLDFAAGKPVTHRRIRAAFENAGRELVSLGRLRPETEQDARAPITATDELFGRHFGTYWEIAREVGVGPSDRVRLSSAAGVDFRILLPELAACYNSAAGGGLEARILFALGDEPASHWHLDISGGACRAVEGTCEEAALTMVLEPAVLARILLRKEDARSAIARGEVRVHDPGGLLPRFGRLFPPPST